MAALPGPVTAAAAVAARGRRPAQRCARLQRQPPLAFFGPHTASFPASAATLQAQRRLLRRRRQTMGIQKAPGGRRTASENKTWHAHVIEQFDPKYSTFGVASCTLFCCCAGASADSPTLVCCVEPLAASRLYNTRSLTADLQLFGAPSHYHSCIICC